MRIFLLNILITLLLVSCNGNNEKEVDKFDFSSKILQSGLYHTLDGVYSELNSIKSEYSSIINLLEIGKSSNGEKSIPLVRITFGNPENSMHFLFVAGTHGDEGAPVEAMLNSIRELAKLGINKNVIIDFVPVHNPYGYFQNERKNKNGIDLNRNFPIGENPGAIEKENSALIDLINSNNYSFSIFFHSANEAKYENVIRVPLEYSQLGSKALTNNLSGRLEKAVLIIEKSQVDSVYNDQWKYSSDMVSKSGIASDWCVSGYLKIGFKKLVKQRCLNSHPSLTIELCYPKTPLDELKLNQEKNEMLEVITSLIKNYNM